MRRPAADGACIGVLDSGIGGLSVLKEIHHQLPDHPTLYIADQVNLPYGPRPHEAVRAFVFGISDYLLDQGAVVLVLACNSASAAALHILRESHPDVPVVGMEPAVKPAALTTQTGVIGVLATQATADGELYRRLIQQYAQDVKVVTEVAPELVQIAESQSQHTPGGRAQVKASIAPILAAGADAIVLACTHFPLLADALAEAAGPKVRLVDPSAAVARQVARVWPAGQAPGRGPHRYATTGDPDAFTATAERLLGQPVPSAGLTWRHGRLMAR